MEGMINVHSEQPKCGETKQVIPSPTRRAAIALMAILDIEFMGSGSFASFAGRSGSF